MMKSAVVVFPGSNCESDTIRAIQQVSGTAPAIVWHKDRLPADTDVAILPGGFSYGDYLRAGAIARFSPVMDSVIQHARSGGMVLGICNGFQVLLEAGLLPGAMMRNRNLHFICRWIQLKVERHDTPFTQFSADVLKIPVAHGLGNYFIDQPGLAKLHANRQVVFRYCSPVGAALDDDNPNGSVDNIAGICSESGNILGMMPHPERAIDQALGSSDGIAFWQSTLGMLTSQAAVPAHT
jgi:phosphoribosylformylglycinamidine synthase